MKVAIAVPARDESERVQACLRAIVAAAQALPHDTAWAVCVVADRCMDSTARIARSELAELPAVVVENEADRPLGTLRDLGLRHATALLGPHDPAHTWLLSTDADTIVPAHWLTGYLALAATGAHAIAGTALLDHPAGLTSEAALSYARVLDLARIPEGHGNVYGANLAIRADAYHAVGGFAPIRTGEDHDLWRRLGRRGYHRTYTEDVPVTTSARTQGRASGGLADLLAALPHHDHDAALWCPRQAAKGDGDAARSEGPSRRGFVPG
ncbi:glycosyltransferase [Actinokineospora globicatena]|uniref:glycosyltransferase n=1 Tax=Actinokineospora globicatena TaxID=103729 RepID=UPI0020A2F60B|nr:glycosyltransferase [Actinokineospora globicatena]MCP2303858.1 Glycosyltransferase like family 2 [Actinokineospora globicatena]